MYKINKVLFYTDLSDKSRHAFGYAATIAAQLGVKIALLHVMEDLPEKVIDRVKSFFGSELWERVEQIHDDYEKDIRKTLIGKRRGHAMILELFGKLQDAANQKGDLAMDEILLEEGDPVENIVKTAKAISADLIVMAAGRTARSVLGKVSIPVVEVPNRG